MATILMRSQMTLTKPQILMGMESVIIPILIMMGMESVMQRMRSLRILRSGMIPMRMALETTRMHSLTMQTRRRTETGMALVTMLTDSQMMSTKQQIAMRMV